MKSSNFAVLAFVMCVSSALTASAYQAPQETAPMPGMSHDASSMSQMKSSNMDSMHMSNSANAAKAPADLQFIDTMAMHHKMAIDMASLAGSRAAHAELKTMASKMIEDQQKETAQLKGWREQWYPSKPEAMNMNMPGMPESMKGMSMDKLAAAKGEEFDRMFIDMMSRHHAGAIKMSETAAPKLQHAELKTFAKNLIAAQKEELAQMKGWKKSWDAKH